MRNADQWRIFVVEEGEKNYVPELGRWQQKALLLQMCLRREWSHVLLPHFGTGGRLVGYAGVLRSVQGTHFVLMSSLLIPMRVRENDASRQVFKSLESGKI